MSIRARVRADACPGVFATHDAADGPLARVRLPGGVVTPAQLRALADAATECGDGDVHLTSRGNVQLRAVTRPGLETRLSEAGLLPSLTHERVRNILASPWSGISGGLADVRGLAAALDDAVCARPGLASLPGRFLFAFDDGRGDVAGEAPDVCWITVGAEEGAVLLAGEDTGVRVSRESAVDALVALAAAFAETRGTAWRVGELDDPSALLPALDFGTRVAPTSWQGTPDDRIGPVPGNDGDATGVAPRFGQLSAAQLRLLADVADNAVVTPWRTIVLPGVGASAREALAGAGFLTDPADPRRRVSACIGRPGCAKSRADVRADAVRLPGDLPAHVSGCERRCGKPSRSHLDVVAAEDGYRVDGTWVPVEQLGEMAVRKGNT
ncbi:precorrin-3B synthase [Amycolatopsis sp. NPDC059021]|uniref:precorrin-3B synthase n=1 Tax=Amycolatopsis sp. NPDC059021 TaxID=3346704 RepID=UPI00366E7A57